MECPPPPAANAGQTVASQKQRHAHDIVLASIEESSPTLDPFSNETGLFEEMFGLRIRRKHLQLDSPDAGFGRGLNGSRKQLRANAFAPVTRQQTDSKYPHVPKTLELAASDVAPPDNCFAVKHHELNAAITHDGLGELSDLLEWEAAEGCQVAPLLSDGIDDRLETLDVVIRNRLDSVRQGHDDGSP